jgi:hypothetical protein
LAGDGAHAFAQQQGFDLLRMGLDFPGAGVGGLRAEFQPVEGAFAGEGFAFVLLLLALLLGSAAVFKLRGRARVRA